MENFYKDKISQIKSLGDGLKKSISYKDEYVIVDVDNRKLLINNKIYEFGEILDCRVTSTTANNVSIDFVNAFNSIHNKTTTKTKTGSLIGRSVVGGAIGGTTGALLGGLTAERTIDKPAILDSSYNDYSIVVTIDNVMTPTEILHIGASISMVSELSNLFQVIISQNKGGKKSAEIDKLSYLKKLRSRAEESKNKISISRNSLLSRDSNLPTTEELYEQIFINEPDSPEAIFYYFFFYTIKNKDKFAHRFSKLYSAYIEELEKYLKTFDKSHPEFTNKFEPLLRDTKLYAKFLSGGYIDETAYGYKLLLKAGDVVANVFSDEYAISFWKEGVSLNHLAGYYNKKKSKEELFPYIEKILEHDNEYIEPHFNNGPGGLDDPDTWQGLLIFVGIIAVILYFIFS